MWPLMIVLFAVLMLCPGALGSDLASSENLASGTAKLYNHKYEISFCPWPVVSLCALCNCHTCCRKEGKTHFPRGKGYHLGGRGWAYDQNILAICNSNVLYFY